MAPAVVQTAQLIAQESDEPDDRFKDGACDRKEIEDSAIVAKKTPLGIWADMFFSMAARLSSLKATWCALVTKATAHNNTQLRLLKRPVRAC